MGQAGHSCAQLRMQLCALEHKHGAGGAILRTAVHTNVYICAQAWGEEAQVRTVVPTIVHSCTQAWGRRGSLVRSCARKVYTDCSLGAMGSRLHGQYVRTYVRTYFLSLCGLAAMGRRSGRVFFLVVVLVPWVAGWAVLSFSLRSWCHGSSPGQWFLSLCGLGAMCRGLGNVFFVVGHRSQVGQFGLSFGLLPT